MEWVQQAKCDKNNHTTTKLITKRESTMKYQLNVASNQDRK